MDSNFGTGGVACVPKKLLDFSDKYMLQLILSRSLSITWSHVIVKRSSSMRFDKQTCHPRFNCVSDVRAFEPNPPARDRAESSCF
jgi:hypothetical protein